MFKTVSTARDTVVAFAGSLLFSAVLIAAAVAPAQAAVAATLHL